jgi:hypothetical protein
MLARIERRYCHLFMQIRRKADIDRIQFPVTHQFAPVRALSHLRKIVYARFAWKIPACLAQIAAQGACVSGAHCRHFHAGDFSICIQMGRSHEPQSRYPDFHERIVRVRAR